MFNRTETMQIEVDMIGGTNSTSNLFTPTAVTSAPQKRSAGEDLGADLKPRKVSDTTAYDPDQMQI